MSSISKFTHVQKVRLLYKGILRLHRSLPEPLKEIGDSYVKNEFKQNKIANQAQTVEFMKEWTAYYSEMVDNLTAGKDKQPFWRPLSQEEMNNFRDDQLQQLYELYKEMPLVKEKRATNSKVGDGDKHH